MKNNYNIIYSERNIFTPIKSALKRKNSTKNKNNNENKKKVTFNDDNTYLFEKKIISCFSIFNSIKIWGLNWYFFYFIKSFTKKDYSLFYI